MSWFREEPVRRSVAAKRDGRRPGLAAFGAVFMLCAMLMGCSRTYYRDFADDQVYEIQRVRQFDERSNVPERPVEAAPGSRMADPADPDAEPFPADDPGSRLFQVTRNMPFEFHGWKKRGSTPIEPPGWLESLPRDKDGKVKLDRQTVIQIALLHSRNYQFEVENLYLAALQLTLAQFQFQLQPFYRQEVFYQHSGGGINESNQMLPAMTAGFSRQFMSGAQLLVNFANNMVFEYDGNGFNTVATQLAVNFTQPLLRDAWARNVTQPLSLQERGVLYQLRDFAHFRRDFYINVIAQGGYLGLLAQLQGVRNQEQNLLSLRRNLNEYEALTPNFKTRLERDQLAQQIQQSEFQLAQIIANLETDLDTYKVSLGLPAELEVALDDSELKRFEMNDPRLDDLRGVANDLYVDLVSSEEASPEFQRRMLEDVIRQFDTLDDLREQARGELRELQAKARIFDENGLPIPLPDLPPETQEEKLRVLADNLAQTLAEADYQLQTNREAALELRERIGVDEPGETWADLSRLVGRELRGRIADYFVAETQIRVQLIPLTHVEMTEEQAIELGLNNRLDLMTARAAVTDAWRNEEVAANRLLAGLSIQYQAVHATDPNFDGLFRFDASGSLERFGVSFDAPIVRRSERNAYRASQIAYQRARRAWMLQRDEVVRQLRLDLRNLNLQRKQFDISRDALIIASRQVDLSEYDLRTSTVTDQSQTLLLLNALNAQLSAKNALIGVWVGYETSRMSLYRNLDLMFLDARGNWINEHDPLVPVRRPDPDPQPGADDLGADATIPAPPAMERP